MRGLAYLDFAATSAARPAAVAAAVASYITDIGASPGRGGHRLALEAGRVVLRCRRALADLLGVPGDPGRVVFSASATLAMNAAIWGVAGRRPRIVVTQLDHNAVLRPATRVAAERDGSVEMVPATPDGTLDPAALERALDGARLLTINAASNVLGTTLDVARICALARAAGVLTLVDAAQLVGHVPFDVAATGADMVAFAGHKGLLGPQGVGCLWVRPGLEIEPFFAGGTGGDSLNRDMPAHLPDRLEAGTMNGPAIAGLVAGIRAVQDFGVAALHARIALLKARLHEGMSRVPGVRVLSPAAPGGVGIVTIVSDRLSAAELASRLDREHGVLTRAGLHCAPETHRLLGTDTSGAVRFSLGWSSTDADVDRAVDGATRILHDDRARPAGRSNAQE